MAARSDARQDNLAANRECHSERVREHFKGVRRTACLMITYSGPSVFFISIFILPLSLLRRREPQQRSGQRAPKSDGKPTALMADSCSTEKSHRCFRRRDNNIVCVSLRSCSYYSNICHATKSRNGCWLQSRRKMDRSITYGQGVRRWRCVA